MSLSDCRAQDPDALGNNHTQTGGNPQHHTHKKSGTTRQKRRTKMKVETQRILADMTNRMKTAKKILAPFCDVAEGIESAFLLKDDYGFFSITKMTCGDVYYNSEIDREGARDFIQNVDRESYPDQKIARIIHFLSFSSPIISKTLPQLRKELADIYMKKMADEVAHMNAKNSLEVDTNA